jgi:hypothetical protein
MRTSGWRSTRFRRTRVTSSTFDAPDRRQCPVLEHGCLTPRADRRRLRGERSAIGSGDRECKPGRTGPHQRLVPPAPQSLDRLVSAPTVRSTRAPVTARASRRGLWTDGRNHREPDAGDPLVIRPPGSVEPRPAQRGGRRPAVSGRPDHYQAAGRHTPRLSWPMSTAHSGSARLVARRCRSAQHQSRTFGVVTLGSSGIGWRWRSVDRPPVRRASNRWDRA